MAVSVSRPNSTQRKEYGKMGDGGWGSAEQERKEVCGVRERERERERERRSEEQRERSAGLPCEHMLGRTFDSLRKKVCSSSFMLWSLSLSLKQPPRDTLTC